MAYHPFPGRILRKILIRASQTPKAAFSYPQVQLCTPKSTPGLDLQAACRAQLENQAQALCCSAYPTNTQSTQMICTATPHPPLQHIGRSSESFLPIGCEFWEAWGCMDFGPTLESPANHILGSD
jgi:hypothetical protein